MKRNGTMLVKSMRLAVLLATGCVSEPGPLFRYSPDLGEGAGGEAAGGAGVANDDSTGGNSQASSGTSAGDAKPTSGEIKGTNTGGSSGTSTADCVVSNGAVEVCDGLDNDCNDGIDEGDVCPPGCRGAGAKNKGYMFCGTKNARSFGDAWLACAARGMQLVAIETQDENDWIASQAGEFGMHDSVWIGATDRDAEGHWEWLDGTPFWMGGPAPSGSVVEGMYAYWRDGKPNNEATNGNVENCATFELGAGWNDRECSNELSFGFVCERN